MFGQVVRCVLVTGLAACCVGGVSGPAAAAGTKAHRKAYAKAYRQYRAGVQWTVPMARARQVARQQDRPLMMVSINGDLDGYC